MNDHYLEHLAEPYVVSFFSEHNTDQLTFHNLEHTRGVVAHVQEICAHENIADDQQLIVILAAWFHDVGHLDGGIANHEERSVLLMKQFMMANNITDASFINSIEKCILATKMPHKPEGLLEEIMCDADVYHFGTKEFRSTNKLVKEELKKRGYGQLTKGWLQHTLKLMREQHFFTRYCQEKLNAGKAENVEWVLDKLKKKGVTPEPVVVEEIKEQLQAEDKKDTKQNRSLISRGIQTLLRLASSNHLKLSDMADGKANILISVNAIIISVILSVLINRLDVEPFLTIPTIIFLTSSVVTIVLAILATRPKLTEGVFTREDVIARKTNLLFFGNFYKSSLPDFEWAMERLLGDKDYIYGTQIKDVYFLGKVLGRKYKLLRIAYNVFMFGIIISVIAFTIAVLFNSPKSNVTILDGSHAPL